MMIVNPYRIAAEVPQDPKPIAPSVHIRVVVFMFIMAMAIVSLITELLEIVFERESFRSDWKENVRDLLRTATDILFKPENVKWE